MRANTYLKGLYLEWVNDWLTVAAFAEHHGLTELEALDLIQMGRWIHEESINTLAKD